MLHLHDSGSIDNLTRAENFGSVLKDCSKALGFNAQSSKAFFRSAVALIALDRIDEALDCCERCLVFDPLNTAVKTISGEAKKKKELKDRKEKERLERIQKEEETKRLMKLAFRVCLSLLCSCLTGALTYILIGAQSN